MLIVQLIATGHWLGEKNLAYGTRDIWVGSEDF